MRKGNESKTKKDTPGWMNTYGDMVTLLLTFFVLLYSFSSIDAEKWQRLVISLSGSNKAILQQQREVAVKGIPMPRITTPEMAAKTEQEEIITGDILLLQAELKEFQKLFESLKKYVSENNLSGQILLSKTDSEILIRFVENVLFDSGKATLKDTAMDILSKIVTALTAYKENIKIIRIEGHTDNVAINTFEFPSNWELSTARAVEVLRFLVEEKQVEPGIVSAVGYGEYHPIGDNDTPGGRARNRRVDFVIARNISQQLIGDVNKQGGV